MAVRGKGGGGIWLIKQGKQRITARAILGGPRKGITLPQTSDKYLSKMPLFFFPLNITGSILYSQIAVCVVQGFFGDSLWTSELVIRERIPSLEWRRRLFVINADDNACSTDGTHYLVQQEGGTVGDKIYTDVFYI